MMPIEFKPDRWVFSDGSTLKVIGPPLPLHVQALIMLGGLQVAREIGWQFEWHTYPDDRSGWLTIKAPA